MHVSLSRCWLSDKGGHGPSGVGTCVFTANFSPPPRALYSSLYTLVCNTPSIENFSFKYGVNENLSLNAKRWKSYQSIDSTFIFYLSLVPFTVNDPPLLRVSRLWNGFSFFFLSLSFSLPDERSRFRFRTFSFPLFTLFTYQRTVGHLQIASFRVITARTTDY